MIYPKKLLEKDDPKIKKTLEDYRKNKMPEGIAMWMVFLHHYITERIAQQHLLLDDQELVLRDFYSILSHTGSCHEGFEHNIKPWGDRYYLIPIRILFLKMDYFNFPPHGWAAVCFNLLLRNMLIREEDNNLHLISAISPEWIYGPITIKNANTYFGICNFALNQQGAKVQLSFSGSFERSKPELIIIHIPYFVDKKSLKIESDSNIELDIDKTMIKIPTNNELKLNIFWEIDKNTDISYLSYKKAVSWLKAEYKKRYNSEIK